jgi:hypothetical protein
VGYISLAFDMVFLKYFVSDISGPWKT